MIGDTFTFNDKTFKIKKDVSFGEYKKISKIGSGLQELARKYEEASEDEKHIVLESFTKTSDEQLGIISDFLESMLGLKQSEIEKMSLFNAVELFNMAFTVSTQVKKKLETTSESQS